MHDTTVDAIYGENARGFHDDDYDSRISGIPVDEIRKGLWPAIREFLIDNPSWILYERLDNNNGLTVLKRNVIV